VQALGGTHGNARMASVPKTNIDQKTTEMDAEKPPLTAAMQTTCKSVLTSGGQRRRGFVIRACLGPSENRVLSVICVIVSPWADIQLHSGDLCGYGTVMMDLRGSELSPMADRHSNPFSRDLVVAAFPLLCRHTNMFLRLL